MGLIPWAMALTVIPGRSPFKNRDVKVTPPIVKKSRLLKSIFHLNNVSALNRAQILVLQGSRSIRRGSHDKFIRQCDRQNLTFNDGVKSTIFITQRDD